MGKRKYSEYYDEEDYISRKIRKLQKKRDKIRSEHEQRRRRRRHSSSPVSDSDKNSDIIMDCYDYSESEREVSPNEETPRDDSAITADKPIDANSSPNNRSVVASIVVPGPSNDTSAVSNPPADAPSEPTIELESEILSILGDAPLVEEKFGNEVHKDIASRWSDILVNGLKDDVKKEIQKTYNVPANLKLLKPPVLNAEIKAAVNENMIKRDSILVEKQNLLSSAITCVANMMSTVLSPEFKGVDKNEIIKSLSDTGRILCHLHNSETKTRRNFLLTSLSKEVKDNIKDIKRDEFLFGNNLQDNLKSIKAISRTGAELKNTVAKQKPAIQNKQPAPSTSRALNWRGPPPSQPPPRRAPARQSSTTGGRKQQTTQRTSSTRRTSYRQQSRNTRR